jgi:hypothetical protein
MPLPSPTAQFSHRPTDPQVSLYKSWLLETKSTLAFSGTGDMRVKYSFEASVLFVSRAGRFIDSLPKGRFIFGGFVMFCGLLTVLGPL